MINVSEQKEISNILNEVLIPDIAKIVKEFLIHHRREWTINLMKAVHDELLGLFEQIEFEKHRFGSHEPMSASIKHHFTNLNRYTIMGSQYMNRHDINVDIKQNDTTMSALPSHAIRYGGWRRYL